MPIAGKVKFYLEVKGYGFISPASGEKDIFVHISAVKKAGIEFLRENDEVTFDLEPGRPGQGPKAVNIRVTKEAPPDSRR